MTSLTERYQMTVQASRLAETEYLTSQERIAKVRFNEMYEAYKRDLDPDFQGVSFVAWGKAAIDVPEGAEAERKYWDIIHTILKSGKFGQVDWNL